MVSAGVCCPLCSSAHSHFADALLREQVGQTRSQVALQDDRGLFDEATAAECLLELLAPLLELARFEIEFLDDGDLFSTAMLAFVANDRARGPFGRELLLRRRSGGKLIA